MCDSFLVRPTAPAFFTPVPMAGNNVLQTALVRQTEVDLTDSNGSGEERQNPSSE